MRVSAVCFKKFLRRDIQIFTNIKESLHGREILLVFDTIYIVDVLPDCQAHFSGRFKIIRYIGDNTWTVMAHHQLVFFLINVVMLLTMTHIKAFSGFSVAKFQTNMWYAYDMGKWQSLLFYSIAGLSVPLLLQYWYEQYLKDFVMVFREKVSAVRFLK